MPFRNCSCASLAANVEPHGWHRVVNSIISAYRNRFSFVGHAGIPIPPGRATRSNPATTRRLAPPRRPGARAPRTIPAILRVAHGWQAWARGLSADWTGYWQQPHASVPDRTGRAIAHRAHPASPVHLNVLTEPPARRYRPPWWRPRPAF